MNLTRRTVVVGLALGLLLSGQPGARAELRGGITVDSTDPSVHLGRKLGPGMPLTAIKPPYPEECGLGSPAPFAAFCDVIPLTVVIPDTVRPSDDVVLSLELTWPVPSGTPTYQENPSSNLEMWLWDDGQNYAGKEPVPGFDGTNTKWTPAEATSDYTLIAAGTGSRRPARIEVWEPRGGRYNVLVMNFNSQFSPQPAGSPCPLSGGPPGCYVITADLDVIPYEPPFEITGP